MITQQVSQKIYRKNASLTAEWQQRFDTDWIKAVNRIKRSGINLDIPIVPRKDY